MRTQLEKAKTFRALHERPGAFIIPNPWDAGTARLLASMGFTSAARVKLMLAENAFLLVIGLLAGAGCALIGIIPAVMTSARSINAPALAGTLVAVLLIGLGASSIAVRLSGAHVTPADLRRE